jgi:LmbE family N-acetylglucosaminyl deacetylase
MAVLGVVDHRWLGYRDGGCGFVEVDRAAAGIVSVINEVAPDTIVTFGLDGITGHSDHIAVSRWVSAAVATLDVPPRVLHAAVDTDHLRRFADLHQRFDVFPDPGYPRPVDPAEVSVRVRLRGLALDRKVAALAAQATQTGPVIAAFGDEAYRQWVAEELFVEISTTNPYKPTLQGAAS